MQVGIPTPVNSNQNKRSPEPDSQNQSPQDQFSHEKSTYEGRLPFTVKQVRDAIPPECFQSSLPRSLSYFFLDIGIIAGLYGIAHYLDSWFFWPVFWAVQGTMFWALFVVGHDCGHQSFSRYKWVNNFIGHLSHTPILVPYHGWRISHRTHHANTGNIETDESWHPITEKGYEGMEGYVKFLRFQMILFLYPFYLFKHSPERGEASHFLPSSPLFKPSEKWDIITSTFWICAMIGGLGFLTLQWGAMWLFKYYLMPYIVFVMWLDLVTYLHHTDPEIPWYRGKDWYFFKGALSTIDHDYGFINNIHHNIGTHVAHHVFLSIPHYHLKEATEAIKPVLGEHYRKSERSIWDAFWNAKKTCHYIDNEGSPAFYKADPSQ
ncbi:MAG: fatty acid desaturase [Cyanobacteria bacterium P01_C01_bin.89]